MAASGAEDLVDLNLSSSSVKLNLAALDASTSSDESGDENNEVVNFRKTALEEDGPKIKGRAWKKQEWDYTDMYNDGKPVPGKGTASQRQDQTGGDSGNTKGPLDGARKRGTTLSGQLHGLMIGQLIENQTTSEPTAPGVGSETASRPRQARESPTPSEYSEDEPIVATKAYEGVVQASGKWDVGVGTTDEDAPPLNRIREFLEDMEHQADAIELELAKAPAQIKAQYGHSLEADIKKIEMALMDDVDEMELEFGRALQKKREDQHRDMETEIFTRRSDLQQSRKTLVEQAIKDAIATHDKQLQASLNEARRLEHRVKIDDDVIAHLRSRVTSLTTLIERPPPSRLKDKGTLPGSTGTLGSFSSAHSAGSILGQAPPSIEEGGGEDGGGIIMQPDAPLPSAQYFGKGLTAIIEEDEEEEEEEEEDSYYGHRPPKLSLWERAPSSTGVMSPSASSLLSQTPHTPRSPLATRASMSRFSVGETIQEEEGGSSEGTETVGDGSSANTLGVADETKAGATGLDDKLKREVDLRNLLHRGIDAEDDVHVYLLESRYEAISEHLEIRQLKEILDLKVGHLEELQIPFERARARYSTLVKAASEINSRVERLRQAYSEWQATAQLQAHDQTKQLISIADRNAELLLQLQSAETKFISDQEVERRRGQVESDEESVSSSSSDSDLDMKPGAHTARRLRRRDRRRSRGEGHAPRGPQGPDWISRTNKAWRLRTEATHQNPLNAIQSRNRVVRVKGNTQANARYGIGGVLAPYEEGGDDQKKSPVKKRKKVGVRFANEDMDLETLGAARAERDAHEARERKAAERIHQRMSIKAIWSAQEEDLAQQVQQQLGHVEPHPPLPGSVRRQRISLAAAASRMNTPRSWDARTRLPVLEDGASDRQLARDPTRVASTLPSQSELFKKRMARRYAVGRKAEEREDAPRLTGVIDPLDGQAHGHVGLTSKMAMAGRGQFFHRKDRVLDERDIYEAEEMQSARSAPPAPTSGADTTRAGVEATAAAVAEATKHSSSPGRQRTGGDGHKRRLHTRTYGAESGDKEFNPSQAYVDQFSSTYGQTRASKAGAGTGTVPERSVVDQLRNIAREYLRRVIRGDDEDGGGESRSSQSAAKALLHFHALRTSGL